MRLSQIWIILVLIYVCIVLRESKSSLLRKVPQKAHNFLKSHTDICEPLILLLLMKKYIFSLLSMIFYVMDIYIYIYMLK